MQIRIYSQEIGARAMNNNNGHILDVQATNGHTHMRLCICAVLQRNELVADILLIFPFINIALTRL